MNTNNTYIKITDEVNDELDKLEPSEDEIRLDNYEDMEYSTPYTDNYDDLFDVGGSIDSIGIFDDR